MQPFTFKTLKIISLLFIVISLVSCKEVFEKDLSMQNISILIPQNNTVTSIRNVHFKWNKLEDATSYTLEIVSPSFSNIYYFDVDSTFPNNEIFIDLKIGVYQWRVRANNNATKTDFTLPSNFTIDSSSDLTRQSVVLTSPINGFISDRLSLNFMWNLMSFADDYDFELREGTDFTSGSPVASNYNILTTSSLVNTLQEKKYIWGVRAKNTTSLSSYKTRSFFVDTTHPIVPTLRTPVNNIVVADSSTINFSWINPTDIGGSYKSNITSIIEIATDSLFGTITHTINSTSSNENYIFNSVGTYFWRMYSKDDASNESYFNSPIRKITIF
jgi:hypothetical protein